MLTVHRCGRRDGTASEMLNDGSGDLVNRAYFLCAWTEIPGAAVRVWMLIQRRCQQQIPGERLEHVLPGSGRRRTAQLHRLFRLNRTDAIRNNAVRGPVSSANDVSSPHRCCTQALAAGEKRAREGREHQF